jgi:hypothetical protein
MINNYSELVRSCLGHLGYFNIPSSLISQMAEDIKDDLLLDLTSEFCKSLENLVSALSFDFPELKKYQSENRTFEEIIRHKSFDAFPIISD